MAKEKAVKTDQIIQEAAEVLLEKIGVEATVVVDFDSESSLFNVQIETDQAGILIGHRGETLSSFQLVLKQILFAGKQEAVNLVVNVGNWRDKREETLKGIALAAVEKAKNIGESQHIYDLSPSERRFVHILLEEENGVTTESEGEGRERHLVVKPSATIS